MLYFDAVISEKLPNKTNLAVLRLDCLVLDIDELNKPSILLFWRFFFSLFRPFHSRSYVLTIVTYVYEVYDLNPS